MEEKRCQEIPGALSEMERKESRDTQGKEGGRGRTHMLANCGQMLLFPYCLLREKKRNTTHIYALLPHTHSNALTFLGKRACEALLKKVISTELEGTPGYFRQQRR